MMTIGSFVISLETSFGVFVVLMVLFAFLSSMPANAVIYYPNRILKGMDPWEGSRSGWGIRNPLAWIKEAFYSTEEDILAISGVDTAVYFVYLSTALGILVLSGVILVPVLLPVAATDTGITITNNGTFNATLNITALDKLSMGNIKEGSKRLWAFLIGVYWVSLLMYYLVWRAFKRVSNLRAKALAASDFKAEQFAVLVRDIPPLSGFQNRKEQVDSYFSSIYPDTFYKSMVVTDNKKVNKIWNELKWCKKKLEHANALYAKSKTVENPRGTKPISRVGFLGLIGKKVDTIDYMNAMISQLSTKLETEQRITLKDRQLRSALVFFTSRVTAAAAAQSLHAQMVDRWTVIEAPEPRQIIWANLSLNYYEREVRQYIIYIIVAVTIMFYMIPITFISAITTLENLENNFKFLKPLLKFQKVTDILQAYLPQLSLIFFLAILPKLLMFFSKLEGIPSVSHAIRATSGKYFYFTVLNVFIGVTISGGILNILKTIQDHPKGIVTLLATSLPNMASFFLTYVALKFFIGYGLEISRLVPLIIFHLRRKYFCKTDREVEKAWKPGDLGYATRFPSDMLILTVVLCYSVIAPLIVPFGVVYFGLGWLVLRNQALKVYVPSFESNGRMWPHMHTRIISAMLLYQLTMLGYFGVKKFYYASILIPLPVLTLIFAFVCSKKFYRFFQCTALEVLLNEPKDAPDMEQVCRSFTPPSLQVEDKEGEVQFEENSAAFSRSAPNV